jgi:membrane protein implicated in regulation of membrane protease activity
VFPRSAAADFLFYGVWTFLVVVGLIVYATPFFLIAMLFALAVGFSPGTALTVFPIAFIAMLFLACVVASKLTRWRVARSAATKSDPGPNGIAVCIAGQDGEPS